jgi:NAD(P)-dependent dehydrogenase (short-subunit alcohol dehydrogenase family)/acyl carrier protein
MPWLRQEAVVLISGGLGGIGLKMARHCADLGAKHLILLGRSVLPAKDNWTDIIAGKLAASEADAEKIRAIQYIEAGGTQVHAIAVDVSDLSAMKTALLGLGEIASNIHGVIHAAGVMDDQLSVLKTESSAKRVLSGKVLGAAVLDQLFTDRDLDFFVLFSSVASYLGLPGQIDYTAANAFLDALAFERAERSNGLSKVINWNAWTDVGMTVDVVREKGGEVQASQPSQESIVAAHPALDSYYEMAKGKYLFSTAFSTEKHWLLSEHVTREGQALIPGTGYIELMRAAVGCLQLAPEKGQINLLDVQFLSAFQLAPHQEKTLYVLVEQGADECSLSIYSDSDELPHATAIARYSATLSTIDALAIDSTLARCTELMPANDGFMDQVFMNFGPRWACLDSVHKGRKEAFLKLSLNSEYQSDIGSFGIHPAMLDMATGSAQFLMDNFSKTQDFFVPVSYGQALILGEMPASFVSHVVVTDEQEADFVSFDVTMADESGKVFMKVIGFTMKKVDVGFLSKQLSSEFSHDTAEHKETSYLESILREAISPEEGLRAFDRLMSDQNGQVQWIVSSVDSARWSRDLDLGALVEQEASLGITFEQEVLHDPDGDPEIPAIEKGIQAHEGIQAVIVRSFQDENSRRRLIAYYVPDDWGQATVTELRKYTKDALPLELVPQQLVELDELPIDEAGELDRTQLLDPFAPIDNHIAPETRTQEKLAKIWQSVVGVNRVSLNENFFDIGGHSLLSIRVIVKVKKEFGVRLDQAIMVLLTLEQMAQEIDSQVSLLKPSQDKASTNTDGASKPGRVGDDADQRPQQETEAPTQKKGLFKSLFQKR